MAKLGKYYYFMGHDYGNQLEKLDSLFIEYENINELTGNYSYDSVEEALNDKEYVFSGIDYYAFIVSIIAQEADDFKENLKNYLEILKKIIPSKNMDTVEVKLVRKIIESNRYDYIHIQEDEINYAENIKEEYLKFKNLDKSEKEDWKFNFIDNDDDAEMICLMWCQDKLTLDTIRYKLPIAYNLLEKTNAKIERAENYTTTNEATELWGLGSTTIRSALNKGDKRFAPSDYKKSGKIWLIKKSAMYKVYGLPTKPVNSNN